MNATSQNDRPLDICAHRYISERNFIKALSQEIHKHDEILAKFFANRTLWYLLHTRINKYLYWILAVVAIACACIAVLGQSIAEDLQIDAITTFFEKYHVATLSAVVALFCYTLITSCSLLDQWKNYRRTLELMIHEAVQFLTGSGSYEFEPPLICSTSFEVIEKNQKTEWCYRVWDIPNPEPGESLDDKHSCNDRLNLFRKRLVELSGSENKKWADSRILVQLPKH